ncbi:hypothetical protein LSCM1_02178 [Leishmania martiniquensis]|uniref:ATP-dependent RNA helicase-like protein n=1 Tax=Leishmania martiniquensis TaxID=1580590 RepID=A0A836KD96_9TRYP|nr:hypothetical protein LSCM1_02178 [Leishmania martiniquensis]
MRAFPSCSIRGHDVSATAIMSATRASVPYMWLQPWRTQVCCTARPKSGTCVPFPLVTSVRHLTSSGAGTAHESFSAEGVSPSPLSSPPRYRSQECGATGMRASPQPRRVARRRAKSSTPSPAQEASTLAVETRSISESSFPSVRPGPSTGELSRAQRQQSTMLTSPKSRTEGRFLVYPSATLQARSVPRPMATVPCRGNSAAVSELPRTDGVEQMPPHGSVEAHSSGDRQLPERTRSARCGPKMHMAELWLPQKKKTKTSRAPRIRSLPGGRLEDAAGVSPLAVDRGAEERVVAMLRSDQEQADPDAEFVIQEPTMHHIPHSQLKRCVLELPLNSRCDKGDAAKNEVFAIGQSKKAKVARALCFMHAEQLLDHYMSGRETASPSAAGTFTAPPPLEERALPSQVSMPKPHEYDSWDEYVDASAAYVQAVAARVKEEAYKREQVPRSGHPVADRATELVRRHPKRYCRQTALQELNESIRDASSLMATAQLPGTVFVATLVLDPQTGLTATGVAKSMKAAKRQCAAHALCILRLLQADVEGRQVTDDTGRLRGSGAPKSPSHKANDDSHCSSAPMESILRQMQPAYRKLVQYHHLLFGKASLMPQTTFTKESSAKSGVTSATTYRCHLTLNGLSCDGTGVNRFEAERAAMETAMADLLLYDERIQAVQAFVNAHPSISPGSIPSAALPTELVLQLQAQLQQVAQQQAANVARESAAEQGEDNDGPDAAGGCRSRVRGIDERPLLRISECAFATDPTYAAQMLDKLRALRRDPVYLAQFHPRRSTLAMATVKTQVLDAVQRHRVTVLCGTTGCGKTTQVPQYILDYEIEHGRGGSCNILVTQPRRLSSFSVAERIAQERLSTVGRDVGYAVRLDARPGRHITVCTTGVLLQIFSTYPELEHISHLIIDEVHERDINCDVILALVKKLLVRNSRLRVVLMSATMEADRFARYFGVDTPVVQVEGAVYPVAIRYLEDIAAEAITAPFYSPAFDALQLGEQRQQQEMQSKGKCTAAIETASSRATASRGASSRKPPKTDYNLVAYLVHRSVQVDLQNAAEGKSILVFLPGWKELTSARAAIRDYQGPYALPAAESRLHIILLHSTIDSAKQRECFMPAPPGAVKVVLATNIAESGITIDDAAVVIDTGLIKTTTWKSRPIALHQHGAAGPSGSSSSGRPTFALVPLDKVPVCGEAGDTSSSDATVVPTPVFSTQLTLGYASQANCTQRKGRAGRTQGGVCYRLFTKELWESLPPFPEADIHRVPLMQVLLKLLSLGHANPKETLQTFIEPPSHTNVDASMVVLRGIGAVGQEDRLTPLGEYLTLLPCDPRIGKMMIVGAVLRCLDSVLTVAACTDVCPFVTGRDVASEARKRRYLLSRGSQSDHVSFLNAYNAFCANGESEDFAKFNLLHTGNIRLISKYKAQYREILLHAGLIGAQDEFGEEGEVAEGADATTTPLHERLGDYGGTVKNAEGRSVGGTASHRVAGSRAQDVPVSEAAPLSYRGALCVDTNSLSRHSFDVALVKACICAALFPNVALLRPPSQALSSVRRPSAARKLELRTKHFRSIKPAKDSVCRRVDGPRSGGVPDREEVLSELRRDCCVASADSGVLSTSPAQPVPALFYIFQDVFGLGEQRQDFLTNLSAVSLWALLLFGASESTTEYNAELSICVVDGWIAVHIDRATFALVTQLRRSLFECLRGKYHNPRDPQNNSALETVTAICRRLLKAPVLRMTGATSPDTPGSTAGSVTAGGAPSWQLVDMGSIIDPLVHLRRSGSGHGSAGAVAGEETLLSVDGDDGDEDDDEDLPNYDPVDGDEIDGVIRTS